MFAATRDPDDEQARFHSGATSCGSGQRVSETEYGPHAEDSDRGPERRHAGHHAARSLDARRKGFGQECGWCGPDAGVSPAARRDFFRIAAAGNPANQWETGS